MDVMPFNLHRFLRLWLQRIPLAMPLLAVLGALPGGQWLTMSMVAVGLPAVLGLRRIAVCALLCGIIAALHQGWRERVAQSFRHAGAQASALCCQGTVVDRLEHGCIFEPEGGGTLIALRGEHPYAEGDFVKLHFAPRETEAPPIKGMFDRREWMESRGIAMEADYLHGERLGHPFSWAALRAVARGVRDELASIFLPPGTESDPRRQVLASLVLGAREHAEADTMVGFRRSGCLHAFAVSGQHVALFAGFLWLLLRLMRVHPSTGRWVQLVVLGCYVLMTGFSVPAVRAYIMLAVLLLGLSLRRRVSLGNAWCFAALLVLLVEPWQLSNAGFLLSFAIYAAICIGIRHCMGSSSWFGPDAFIPPRLYTRQERWQQRSDYALRGTVIVSLCAWLVSLPLTATLFHSINTLGFVTNILIAPLVGLVMLAGLAMLALSCLPALGSLITTLALGSSQLLLSLTGYIAGLPGAYLPTTEPRPAHAAVLLDLGFGNTCCVLGNPGLIIHCGNENTTRFRVEPAIFHAGFHPAALVTTERAGAELLRLSWPKLQLLCPEQSVNPLILDGNAGRFTLYPPPSELPPTPEANQSPVILWETPHGKRLLYIGDASMATVNTLPASAQRADIIILGRNPKRPAHDALWLRACQPCCIVLLPSAGDALMPGSCNEEVRIIRLEDGGHLELDTLF